MKRQLTLNDFGLRPADEKVLERRLARLEKRLGSFDPDLVTVEIVMERLSRTREFVGQFRLVVAGRVFTASRNSARTPRGLMTEAFSDLEEQLERWLADLRRENERRPTEV